jgi:hypothetical protein
MIINPPPDQGVPLVVGEPHGAAGREEQNQAANGRYFDCLERFR